MTIALGYYATSLSSSFPAYLYNAMGDNLPKSVRFWLIEKNGAHIIALLYVFPQCRQGTSRTGLFGSFGASIHT